MRQLSERSTSCFLGAECNGSLRDALSFWRAGWGDATDGELMSAAASGKVEEVGRLLEAGANIDERDSVSGGVGTSGCFT